MREGLLKPTPTRKTPDLRNGRLSIAGATYFVTFCTAGRVPALSRSATITAAHAACRNLVLTGDISALTATAMPDHVHLLFRLGDQLPLDRVVSKWKAQVRRTAPGIEWQANFFEHRLRPDESSEPYAWYIFMNPYRAGLITCAEYWPGWWADGGVAYEFLAQTRPGPCPQPEWMDTWQQQTHSLTVGSD